MENNEIHAHIETSMTDCDGRMDREYIRTFEPGTDDYDVRAQVLAGLVSWSDENRVTFGDEDGEFGWSVEVRYAHDEGTFYGEGRLCRNEACDPNRSSQRDHAAEAMGY